MNAGNKIDDLFREAMTGYPVEPSIGLWRRIERRFFPPSRFSPSGLITSGILIFIAGLMPWVLIPAKGGEQKEPEPRPEGAHRGYIINPSDQQTGSINQDERTYTVQTTYFTEPAPLATNLNREGSSGTGDPFEEGTSGYLLASLDDEGFYLPDPSSDPDNAYRNATWFFRMHSHSAGLMDNRYKNEINPVAVEPSVKSTFSAKYENAYFKKSEFSIGANFEPSIVFYNPNPYNQMLGGDAYGRMKISNWSVSAGIGYSMMQDVGSYEVNYKTYDSVGYYFNVVSFRPDPNNPGNVIYTTEKEILYDSVPHYTISDKTNRYSYLDFPVSFGYTFFEKGRFSMQANAGIKFSVLVAKDEPTVDFNVPNGELIYIDRQVPARMNTNWRFTAGIDFGYVLTRQFSFHLEPAFEQYISPLYKSQSGIMTKKPTIAGLKAGLRYTF